jgi:hypothetical protein
MRYFSFVLLFFTILMFSPTVKAVALGGLDETAGVANIKNTPASPELVVGRVLGQVISFVGIIFFILMLYAGFLWMTAAGDEKKIEQAKQILLAAIIGLVIVGAAYAITKFVGQSLQNPIKTNTSNTP